MLIKEGEEPTLAAISAWLPQTVSLEGSEFHYNVFESLLSGRSLYRGQFEESKSVVEDDDGPSDQFRKIYKAQVLKDEAMAYRINSLIKESHKKGMKDDKFLVIAGNGHFLHYCGVPERVLRENANLKPETCLVISESSSPDAFEGDENYSRAHTIV